MVSPNMFGLTIRSLFYPPLKLILPEPPRTAHFKARGLGFPGKERVNMA